MALETGIPLDAVLHAVQRSNMSKLGEDGRPLYRADGKVLKGPGFFEPDIATVLATTRCWRATRAPPRHRGTVRPRRTGRPSARPRPHTAQWHACL
jgi:predicted HAD superfamily Cof-like phosphohydrolase